VLSYICQKNVGTRGASHKPDKLWDDMLVQDVGGGEASSDSEGDMKEGMTSYSGRDCT
jgi:hypothetical protein